MQDLNALPLPDLLTALTADGSVERLFAAARAEDLGSGDVTTASIVEPTRRAGAALVAREDGIVAGLPLTNQLLAIFGEQGPFDADLSDGERCVHGQRLGRWSGPLAAILAAERTLLNLLSRLSGIATLTGRYVEAVEGTAARICDTRKTTPGMRSLEKYAVRCGGGTLHRIGLYDAAIYKDNHLAHVPLESLAETIRGAAARARAASDLRFVEVEVDSLEQLEVLLSLETGEVDLVLLDNMTPNELRRAVALRNELQPALRLEASGGVNLTTVREIALSGVDRISVAR